MLRVVSLELDPVHACIARHIIDLALLAAAAESAVGQAKDTVPGLPEALGCGGAGFAFMDQRGTAFHEDLRRLEGLRLPGARGALAADNVAKPGAPVYLWHLARGQGGAAYAATAWSLA